LRDSPGFAPGSSACAIVASASHRALTGRARRPAPIHWAARSRAHRATREPAARRDTSRPGRRDVKAQHEGRPPPRANLPRLRPCERPAAQLTETGFVLR